MQPFIFATDFHGIEADPAAVKAFKSAVELIDAKNKHLRIFGGDLFNFAALRRGADHDEKEIRLREDYEAGMAFLEWYRPKVLLLGNHDQRLWDVTGRERVKKSGWLSELAQNYIEDFAARTRKLRIQVLPYDKKKGVFRSNGVAFAHGFGSGSTLPQNMASAYGTVVFGHGHKIIRDTVMKGNKTATGYEVGCLCRHNMEYTRSDLGSLRQQHGFAYGVLDHHRSVVLQPEIVSGTVIVAELLKKV